MSFASGFPNKTWPTQEYSGPEVVGGWLTFYGQPFELYVDKRSAMTSGKQSATSGLNVDHGDVVGVANITLPYVNSVSNETSTWDTGNQESLWNRTDADSGFKDIGTDLLHDFFEWFDARQHTHVTNMEVSNAGYKGPVLRQRHYTWTMINRTGTAKEGMLIAGICRKFQACVYPRMTPARTADNIILPPPMFTIMYSSNVVVDLTGPNYTNMVWGPNQSNSYITKSGGATDNIDKSFRKNSFGHGGQRDDHPSVSMAGHNAWRWNMDPLTAVLVNVSISPTSATDSIQVPTASGWPLVTVLKLSFLEVDQTLAGGNWDWILPYSWATDEDNKFFGGFEGGGISPL